MNMDEIADVASSVFISRHSLSSQLFSNHVKASIRMQIHMHMHICVYMQKSNEGTQLQT
jgi:hypothetical protein